MAKTAKKAAKKSSPPAKKTAKKAATSELGNPSETFDKMKGIMEEVDKELTSFLDAEKKVAGRRARKGAHELKKLCLQLRKEIQETIKGM